MAESAFVVALFGSRGSGKSAAAKEYLASATPPRLLIWDPMNEYGQYASAVPRLVRLIEAGRGKEPFALRYVPERASSDVWRERFDTFCAIAYELGNLMLVVEELQLVTTPSWAPPAWSDCTLRGRHRNLAIIGMSQRPASVDKNFFGNATLIRTGRLNFQDDVQCMARVLGVPGERVRTLTTEEGPGWARCAYIERETRSGAVTEGVLELGGAGRALRAKKTGHDKAVMRKKS